MSERSINNLITGLQELIAARIAGLDYFVGPPAIVPLTEKTSQLRNKVDQAIKKLGLSIFVATPKVQPAGNRRDLVKVSIVISELVAANQSKAGSGIAAVDAALACKMAITWADPLPGQEAQLWQPAEWWEPFRNVGFELHQLDPLVTYEVTGETGICLRVMPGALAEV